MDEKEKSEKKNTKAKELIMIALVVVLAFGLTVTGIVYLTKFLLGDDSTPAAQTTPQTQPVDNDSVVRFSLDNETESIPIEVPPPADPVIPPPATVPPPPPPLPPATTPPPPPPPAAVTQTPTSTPAVIPGSSPTSGRYQLQLYAFRAQATAEAEARKLQSAYPDIFVMRADLGNNGVWYRVRCCSTDSKEEAEQKKADIGKKYKITPYIVNR